MKVLRYAVIALMGLTLAAGTAAGWGQRTETAIVTTAVHVLSKEGGIRLVNLEQDVRGGVQIPGNALEELVPRASENLQEAIEGQIYLLQSVRADRVDPYFAYRLGVLGKLVARATAPLQDADPQVRDQYYQDVEGQIQRANLRTARRQQIDPDSYLPRITREAQSRDDMLLRDYQAGLGFDGVARGALAEDASRSVNAVADVWYTILTGGPGAANISVSQMRDYALGALEFYIYRGNTRETETMYQRLAELGVKTPDLRADIGDMFFDAGRYERAMEEYRRVVEEAPHRRDIREKMAAHYTEVGEQYKDEGSLEEAQMAFQNALEADQRDGAAQERLLLVKRELSEREERRAKASTAISEGESLREEAIQRAQARDYGSAIELLQQAQRSLGDVSDEFPQEAHRAGILANELEIRLREIRESLVANASRLSGSGSAVDPKRLAQVNTRELNEEALRKLVANQYRDEVNQLRDQLRQDLFALGAQGR